MSHELNKQGGPDLTFLVLCGGMGSRMRGQDKPLLKYKGTPMIDLVLASAPDLPYLISANRNLQTYAQRAPVFTDREVDTEIASPLNGVLGALERINTEWLLVAPGDSPALPNHWWHPLYAVLDETTSGAVVHDGERQQNLHLILNRRLGPQLRQFLRDGHGEVWRFLQTAGVIRVDVPHPDWFKNVNEAEDLG